MTPITLSEDQQTAYEQFIGFITDPNKNIFVLSGYAGVGKSTLVRHILDTMPATIQTLELITEKEINWEIHLTATTNKAAQALMGITNQPVSTIHSLLGLRVTKDHRTGKSQLIRRSDAPEIKNSIVFIDEASFIDHDLMTLILENIEDSKIIFIGDPAQLTPIKHKTTPVFMQGFETAELTKVMRQAEGNPIIELATAFRNTVHTGQFFQFEPDGTHIQHLTREDFEKAALAEFSRPDWTNDDSKVLAWTNATVIAYNKAISNEIMGYPELRPGDLAVCNHYVSTKRAKAKTDEVVMIDAMTETKIVGINGWNIQFNQSNIAFMPKDRNTAKALLKEARKEKNWAIVNEIENWIDLRAAYACTINKSQGSTYKKVFIDLDDVSKCRDGNLLARMLYVAISRASEQVIMTGDLV
jgi:hypothetical protein